MAKIDEVLLTDLKAESGGDLMTASGLENVRDALFRRLVTEPGSIVHRPDYGVGIKRFQNAPATMATKNALALRIDEQFARDPRVEKVLGVSFQSDDYNPQRITINVRVKLVGYGEAKMQFIPFDEVPS